jgi:hopanoid C-3 methylase
MRVLLVMPTPFETGRLSLENVIWLSEPVALTAVGTAISDRHEVKILDLRLEDEQTLARTILEFLPDVVGTTSMTTDAYQAKAVLRMARAMRPSALTIVGGHHPTLTPEEFDEPYIDVIVQGEGELTLREIMDRWEAQRASFDRAFEGVKGTRYRDSDGVRRTNAKREQTVSLDDLPSPDRRLIKKYQGRYFFTGIRPMASIYTSRGCSFDCNFCAIWEFYERRTRFLSARRIVDQMEACEEPFVFVLDDNFLTSKRRVVELCEELERRRVRKFWMTQGRTDFAADHPDLIARLARNGLVMVLSGFESNDDDNLASLRKKSTWEKNQRANQVMQDAGIFFTGIFMVRADWTHEQFEQLYEYVNSLTIGIPLFTILTPLPGTQLYRAYKDKLLTTDHRLFDLIHAVLPTRLPRAEFYKELARGGDVTSGSCTTPSGTCGRSARISRSASSPGCSGSTRAPGATSASTTTTGHTCATRRGCSTAPAQEQGSPGRTSPIPGATSTTPPSRGPRARSFACGSREGSGPMISKAPARPRRRLE